MKMHVAIIGAGLSGLTAACRLQKDHHVTVFEQSGVPGGRSATCYASPYAFDHGAQFFIVKDYRVKAFINPMLHAGVIAPWHARFIEMRGQECIASRQWGDDYPHYVGVPGMHAIGAYLARGLQIQYACCVAKMTRHHRKWMLHDAHGDVLGAFDWVLLSLPAAKALALLPSTVEWRQTLKDFTMKACYSLMLGFVPGWDMGFDAALIGDACISWLSANHSKPGRCTPPSYVIHATNAWADEHLSLDDCQVKSALLSEAIRIFGDGIGDYAYVGLHRWPFANIDKQTSKPYLLDIEGRLGVCGDWLTHGRVEAAIGSGIALSEHLIELD